MRISEISPVILARDRLVRRGARPRCRRRRIARALVVREVIACLAGD
jgi:hypothetical protein